MTKKVTSLKERIAELEQILHWCSDAFEDGSLDKREQARQAIRRYTLKQYEAAGGTNQFTKALGVTS